jgi:4-aminobutyrate aminotransferase/(S)-3-amino-2-methylpropionate transaminase
MDGNERLYERRREAVPQGIANSLAIFCERAKGAEIWDVEGRRYVDFASGISVLNTGHLHPRVQAAAEEQLRRVSHACFQVTPYEGYVALAERLNALVPGPSPKRTLLLTTGAEAVENAVKIARAWTKRSAVIAFAGGFHGRTLLALALTGKVAPYKSGFGPFPGECYHAPFPCEYLGVSVEDSPFLRALRDLCDEHGIALVVDEIQTGFGRTGRMFAMEHSGIEPDLVTMAKSLAGGFPLSAVTGKAEIMDAPHPGGLGGTYAGSPIACAAALAVLDVIDEEKLLDRAQAIGERIEDRMGRLARERFACIGDLRRLGAMVAMELVRDRETREPDAELTRALVQRAAARGLVILACGMRGNVIRFLVPLTASDAIVDEGLDLLEACLGDLVGA